MGNFMIGDFYPSFLGWVDKIYLGEEQCWPKNSIRDTDCFCFKLDECWATQEEENPCIPYVKHVTITGAQIKAGERLHPFDTSEVWIDTNLVLHVKVHKCAVDIANLFYYFWKGKSFFNDTGWTEYYDNEITVQLKATDFRPIEYVSEEHIYYWFAITEDRLQTFKRMYPDTKLEFIFNDWDRTTTFLTREEYMPDDTFTYSYINGKTTWAIKVQDLNKRFTITGIPTAAGESIMSMSRSHAWEDVIAAAEAGILPTVSETFKLEPKSKPIELKILIVNDEDEVISTAVDRVVSLKNPMPTSTTSGNWRFEYAHTTSNIMITPTWIGDMSKRYSCRKIECTNPTYSHVGDRMDIPRDYVELYDPQVTVTWYMQEVFFVRLTCSSAVYNYAGDNFNRLPSEELYFRPKYASHDSDNISINVVDGGDYWEVHPNLSYVYPDGHTSDWRLKEMTFEKYDDYTGEVKLEDNVLYIKKADIHNNNFKWAGHLHVVIADYDRSSKASLDIASFSPYKILENRAQDAAVHWDRAMNQGLPYFINEQYNGKDTTKFTYRIYESGDYPYGFRTYDFDPEVGKLLLVVCQCNPPTWNSTVSGKDVMGIVLKDGVPTWLRDFKFMTYI